MGQFHELRTRHNRFVEQLDLTIQDVINDNQSLLDLNRKQLKDEHKDTLDRLIKPEYSPWYARLKGFKTPDLFATGETHKTLMIEATGDQFNIKGTTDQAPGLEKKYGPVFGIAKSMLNDAKSITTVAIAKIYRTLVFKS